MKTKRGTPTSIPMNPKTLPKINNENKIQKALIFNESPKILGPIRLPSICWMIIIKIRKIKAWFTDTKRIMKNDGMAPMKGPKKGIIFVTLMMNAISNA